jgi:hypothetical protein
MGGISRCCGDVGGALASQCGERNDGKQWRLRTWSGRRFLPHSVFIRRREARAWEVDVDTASGMDWAEDGLAEVQGCTAQIVSLTLFDSCPPTV